MANESLSEHHGISEDRVMSQLEIGLYEAIDWTEMGSTFKVLDPTNNAKFHEVNKDWSTFTKWKQCSICIKRDKR